MLRLLRDRLTRDVEAAVDLHAGSLVAAILAERNRHREEEQEHLAAAKASAAAASKAEVTLKWLQGGQGPVNPARVRDSDDDDDGEAA